MLAADVTVERRLMGLDSLLEVKNGRVDISYECDILNMAFWIHGLGDVMVAGLRI